MLSILDPITESKKLDAFKPNKVTMIETNIAKVTD